ncbi:MULTISPECIES: class I SAM-dependent methyltransferase [Dyella]|uniref:Class I SAM-dependent methyltransferase n=2 Tax=Dyella TaxID=231454 RepID=A0A4V2NLB4_9GAMM|nr:MULTISPECIES: class I SAM-dependent methyltransferase [Dyella]TBR36614.1 class I SAM-dependent methyltransferase [Dyella terrae]TCI08294.1 class I SAM-dependent methyltransferase [Dyella soli]
MVDETPLQHWNAVWDSKTPDAVSWYQRRPDVSLSLIAHAQLPRDARIIDVGGGASTLVDHLLAEGFDRISVLDIADGGMRRARERLGAVASSVQWLVQDARYVDAPASFDLWHDRAVFHFLTDSADRTTYLQGLARSLAPRGQLIVATFALDGPERCSGLPVMRYDVDTLHDAFGREAFELLETATESHRTPWDAEQRFTYVRLRRRY